MKGAHLLIETRATLLGPPQHIFHVEALQYVLALNAMCSHCNVDCYVHHRASNNKGA